jgi:hypothetical protein
VSWLKTPKCGYLCGTGLFCSAPSPSGGQFPALPYPGCRPFLTVLLEKADCNARRFGILIALLRRGEAGRLYFVEKSKEGEGKNKRQRQRVGSAIGIAVQFPLWRCSISAVISAGGRVWLQQAVGGMRTFAIGSVLVAWGLGGIPNLGELIY